MTQQLSLFTFVLLSQNETRFAVDLNNFGFYANGTLDVKLHNLRIPDQGVNYSLQPVRSVCCWSLPEFVLPSELYNRWNYVLEREEML